VSRNLYLGIPEIYPGVSYNILTLWKSSILKMGAEAPIPPIAIPAAAPAGALPRRPQLPVRVIANFPVLVIPRHHLRPRILGGVKGLQTRDTRKTSKVLRGRDGARGAIITKRLGFYRINPIKFFKQNPDSIRNC
jgi:hypothetical protein